MPSIRRSFKVGKLAYKSAKAELDAAAFEAGCAVRITILSQGFLTAMIGVSITGDEESLNAFKSKVYGFKNAKIIK